MPCSEKGLQHQRAHMSLSAETRAWPFAVNWLVLREREAEGMDARHFWSPAWSFQLAGLAFGRERPPSRHCKQAMLITSDQGFVRKKHGVRLCLLRHARMVFGIQLAGVA